MRITNRGMALGLVLMIVGFALLLAATRADATTRFQIGFTVRTDQPTNVVVRWKVRCSADHWQTFAEDRGQFEARTPIDQTVPQTLDDATFCRVRVVAWDVPPWADPHQGQRPVVRTWVRT